MTEWEQDLRETGALLEGHFLLTSGKHSDRFVLLPRLTAEPGRLMRWIDIWVPEARKTALTVVAGPAMGGVILSWALAERLGGAVTAVFAEKEPDGTMAIRRGFRLTPADRVFLVEDAMTTGGSLLKTRDAVIATGAQVVGAATLVDRRARGTTFPIPLTSVMQLGAMVWEPDRCPLCLAGGEPERPKLRA